MKGSARMVVAPQHTASHVGSGRIAVLTTPVMVNLMEAAVLAAVEAHLPQGHQSSAACRTYFAPALRVKKRECKAAMPEGNPLGGGARFGYSK